MVGAAIRLTGCVLMINDADAGTVCLTRVGMSCGLHKKLTGYRDDLRAQLAVTLACRTNPLRELRCAASPLAAWFSGVADFPGCSSASLSSPSELWESPRESSATWIPGAPPTRLSVRGRRHLGPRTGSRWSHRSPRVDMDPVRPSAQGVTQQLGQMQPGRDYLVWPSVRSGRRSRKAGMIRIREIKCRHCGRHSLNGDIGWSRQSCAHHVR